MLVQSVALGVEEIESLIRIFLVFLNSRQAAPLPLVRRLSKMYRESLPFQDDQSHPRLGIQRSSRLLGGLNCLHETPHNPPQLCADRNELQTVVVATAVSQDRSHFPLLRRSGKTDP